MKIGLVCFATAVSELGDPDCPVPALAGALVAHGHQVTLLIRRDSPRLPPWLRDATFEVRVLTAGPPGSLRDSEAVNHVGVFVQKLRGELRRGGYDVLHSHGWLAGLATQLAAPTERGAGDPARVPLVHTFGRPRLTATLDDDPGAPDSRRVRRTCALRADHLIATSAHERDTLLGAGVARHRISVVPPGTRTDERADPATRPRGFGAIPRQRGNPHRLLLFGSPTRAASTVAALTALPRTELTVCPTEPAPGDAVVRLDQLAARLGVGHRVRVEHGPTPALRRPLIGRADLVLCLAASGHDGAEHLEAMAQGVPVIAGNAQAAEAVIDGVTGAHPPDLRTRTLTKLIRTLLASTPAVEQMEIAGRDRVLSRYNWPRIADETVRVYQLCSTRAGAPPTCGSERTRPPSGSPAEPTVPDQPTPAASLAMAATRAWAAETTPARSLWASS